MPEELKKSQTKKTQTKKPKDTKKTKEKKVSKKISEVEERKEEKLTRVLMPIIDKVDAYKTMIEYLLKRNDIMIVIGVKEKFSSEFKEFADKKNIKIRCFENHAKKEEILNSLSEDIGEGKFIVLRRPIKENDMVKFIESNSDLTYFVRTRPKFLDYLYNLFRNIIINLLGFQFFEDMSAVGFGENLNDLMKNFTNLSYCSRFNRYIGLTQTKIETTEKNALPEYDKAPVILEFLAGMLFFLGTIVGMVLISVYVKVSVLIVLLFILWFLIALSIGAVSVIVLVQNVSVGSLRFKKAKEI